MDWEKAKADFEWDGSWRDIYVLNTNADDWQCLVEHLEKNYVTSCSVNGEKVHQLPDASKMFQTRSINGCFMVTEIKGINFNCHFFVSSQIEFDMNPREISDGKTLQIVLYFMRKIGILLQKEVILTLENQEEKVIFRFLPESDCMTYQETIF